MDPKLNMDTDADVGTATISENQFYEGAFSKENTEAVKKLFSESNAETITVNIPKYEEAKLCATNYINVNQGTKEWVSAREGTITASKLPALLGLYGHKEFNDAWFCINSKLDERLYQTKKFKHFESGMIFEKASIGQLFNNVSNN